jgi:hypothetical protein
MLYCIGFACILPRSSLLSLQSALGLDSLAALCTVGLWLNVRQVASYCFWQGQQELLCTALVHHSCAAFFPLWSCQVCAGFTDLVDCWDLGWLQALAIGRAGRVPLLYFAYTALVRCPSTVASLHRDKILSTVPLHHQISVVVVRSQRTSVSVCIQCRGQGTHILLHPVGCCVLPCQLYNSLGFHRCKKP